MPGYVYTTFLFLHASAEEHGARFRVWAPANRPPCTSRDKYLFEFLLPVLRRHARPEAELLSRGDSIFTFIEDLRLSMGTVAYCIPTSSV